VSNYVYMNIHKVQYFILSNIFRDYISKGDTKNNDVIFKCLISFKIARDPHVYVSMYRELYNTSQF